MVTEVMGFLILFGALLFFTARYIARKRTQPARERQEITQSTAHLREELEQSANAIIGRLGGHVDHLEALLKDADAKTAVLDARLAECRKLEAELELRSAELAQRAQQTLAAAKQQEMAARSTLEPERVDARDFAAVLEDSMQRDAKNRQNVSYDQAVSLAAAMREPQGPAAGAAAREFATPEQPYTAAEREMEPEPQQENLAAKARAMLLGGFTVEEAARETGLGKGAVQLIQEMTQREIEKNG
ncbi:MAG: hypothetical protein SOV43_04725 [Selenomonadaceae bacterium]|nr:hypothetical protein [Selenomonadaceae bacterium]MDY2685457.1 hypothetical protein [Selenomonadaceae bacterium]